MLNDATLYQNQTTSFAENDKPHFRSTLVGRNVVVSGHRTSVRLEPEMWDGLQEICRREHSTLHKICTAVSLQKADASSLTAAIRVYIMRYYRNAATEEGHGKIGHGYEAAFGVSKHGAMGYAKQSAGFTKTSFA